MAIGMPPYELNGIKSAMSDRRILNLVAPQTHFVGRAGELESGLKRLADCVPTWVSGPPGVGKTRFALELAQQTALDSVWFVDAHGVATADEMNAVVSQTVGSDTKDVAALAWTLGQRRSTLVILDNVDEALDAAARLSEALQHVGVAVILTSRLAPSNPAINLQGLSAAESMELLEDRSGRSNLLANDLVTALDGLPLALELAAQHMDVMSVPAILKRFASDLKVLGDDRLRVAIDETWQRLEPGSRRLLVAASVCRGMPFDLDILEASFGAPAEGLRQLLSHSLLQRESSGEIVQFRILDTVATFATLADEAYYKDCQKRYAHYIATLSSSLLSAEDTPEVAAAIKTLKTLSPHLGRAMGIVAVHSWPSVATPIALATALLHRYLDTRDRAIPALIQAIEQEPDADARFGLRATLAHLLVDLNHAGEASAQVQSLVRDTTTPLQKAQLVRLRSRVAHTLGKLKQGVTLAEESLSLAKACGDPLELGRALRNSGSVCFGDPDLLKQAIAQLDASASIFRKAGAPHAEALAHYNRAFALEGANQPELLWRSIERARELFALCGDTGLRLECDWLLGMMLATQGETEQAAQVLEGVYDEALHAGMLGLARAAAEILFSVCLEVARHQDAALQIARQKAILDVEFNAFGVHWIQVLDARLLAHKGELERAVELLAARLDHPSSHWDPGTELWPLGTLLICLGALGLPESLDARMARVHELKALLGTTQWADFAALVEEASWGLAQNDAARVVQAISDAKSTHAFGQSIELRTLVRLITQNLASAQQAIVYGPEVLLVTPGATKFRAPNADWVDLASRPRLSAALNALVEADGPMPPESLIAVLWPNEVLTHESGLNRLRATLSMLRKQGLKSFIVFRDGGYLLDAEVAQIDS